MSRLDRQSFLGPDSDAVLETATIGIVGLGGGGSHVVQQAAHMGIGGYVNVDPQAIDETNTNRLVGSTLADVCCKPAKTGIVRRLVRRLNRFVGGTLGLYRVRTCQDGYCRTAYPWPEPPGADRVHSRQLARWHGPVEDL